MARGAMPRRHNVACRIAPVFSQDCSALSDTTSKPEPLPADAMRAWAHLPVLELVLQHLSHGCGARHTKDMFSASGVCRSWRAVCQSVFFSNSWQQSSPVITHPSQLYTLCPSQHAKSGLHKCFIIRDLISASPTGKSYKYNLYQGNDYSNKASAKFLLAAVAHKSSKGFAIHMDYNCSSKPIARLSGNIMGTAYSLESYVSSSSSSSGVGSSSSSSSKGIGCMPFLQVPNSSSSSKCAAAGSGGVEDLLRVTYKLRMRGMMLPRRMSVALPIPQQQQQRCNLHSSRGSSSVNADDQLTAAAATQSPQSCLQYGMLATAISSSSSSGCSSNSSSSSSSGGSSSSNAPCEISNGSTCTEDDCEVQRYDQCYNSSSSSCQMRSSTDAMDQRDTAAESAAAKQQQQQLHYLHNKAPHWNEALRCWCLNFRGRVRLASVKNFQLITDPYLPVRLPRQQLLLQDGSSTSSSAGSSASSSASSSVGRVSSSSSTASSSTVSTMSSGLQDPPPQQQQQQFLGPLAAHAAAGAAAAAPITLPGSPHTNGIVTQFGKVESDVFILDYDPVLITALQAFAVALTSFGAKVLL